MLPLRAIILTAILSLGMAEGKTKVLRENLPQWDAGDCLSYGTVFVGSYFLNILF
jgi:hypothetical protein